MFDAEKFRASLVPEPEPEQKTLILKVPADVHEFLSTHAKENKQTLAALLRVFIADGIDKINAKA